MRLAVTIVALVLLAGPVAADEPLQLRYEDDRLTVRLQRVPLDQVMAAIVAATGLELRGELQDWREVSKEFEALPLGEALDRLLGRQNFALRYDRDGQPRTLRLYGLSQPRAPAPKTRTSPRTLMHAFNAAPAVSLPPRLRDVLRTPQARPARLLGVAARQGDPAVRAEARAVLVQTVNANAALRKALAEATDDGIVATARSWPSGARSELLLQLAREVSDPTVRGMFLRAHLELIRERTARGAVAQR